MVNILQISKKEDPEISNTLLLIILIYLNIYNFIILFYMLIIVSVHHVYIADDAN